MTDRRVLLDPSILGQISASMDPIRAAWDADVAALQETQVELADTKRLLNAAADRANDLQADLATARQENTALIHRNAYLEEEYRRLFESSMDVRDSLDKLATRVVASARSAPAIVKPELAAEKPATEPIPTAATPVNDDEEDDGTGLPLGRPTFLDRTMPPLNEFITQR